MTFGELHYQMKLPHATNLESLNRYALLVVVSQFYQNEAAALFGTFSCNLWSLDVLTFLVSYPKDFAPLLTTVAV